MVLIGPFQLRPFYGSRAAVLQDIWCPGSARHPLRSSGAPSPPKWGLVPGTPQRDVQLVPSVYFQTERLKSGGVKPPLPISAHLPLAGWFLFLSYIF